MKRAIFAQEHEEFRQMVATFIEREVAPNMADWSQSGRIDKRLFRKAGEIGLLGIDVDSDHGGSGISDDYRFNAILAEELCSRGLPDVAMAICGLNDLVLPYLSEHGSSWVKRDLLPRFCSGELYAALALSEPGGGSDLRGIQCSARHDGSSWILRGSKTFVSNGLNADFFVVAAKTGSSREDALSLFVVNATDRGVSRGAPIQKTGLPAQDTVEIFFDDVSVDDNAVLGEIGCGFSYLKRNLARERLLVGIMSLASSNFMLKVTRDYVGDRQIFGRPLSDRQNTRFKFADLVSNAAIQQSFVDRCIADLSSGSLDPVDAAIAKLMTSEFQQQVAYECVQLHGGYGFSSEYPIAQESLNARATTLYAGTSEIMREIIGKSVFANWQW